MSQGGNGMFTEIRPDYINLMRNHIITPFKVDSDYKVSLVFNNFGFINNAIIFGNGNTTNGSKYMHLTMYNHKWYSSNGSAEINFGNSDTTGKHTFEIGGTAVKFDDSNVSTYTATDLNNYLWIGWRGNTQTSYDNVGIYEFKIESINTGNILMDLKPWVLKRNGNDCAIGLLDEVSGKIWTGLTATYGYDE